ncbi:SusC/RagA family TonB-linked outer membrane protein [Sphingobacterium sp. HJSM2_6]|uniref:SusC/RagA family TonB-linked outer membrane protein n=1 Tax=Sphingobacterium sp. HJSM2_6 TaxID=3366264 RepID=UPI003BD3A21F
MFKNSNLIFIVCLLLFGQLPNKLLANIAQSANTLQQQKITGKVFNSSGRPIKGASISINGSNQSTVSDQAGHFSISGKIGDSLKISFLGYQTASIVVDQFEIQITLKESSEVMEEVIVIGYGTTSRKSVIAAVDQISKSAIAHRPVSNLSQALQGLSPSLGIQQLSMDPNNNRMNINIRGVSTLNSNSPLVVIDGLVSDQGTLNNLNPSDVENVSILKDAGSAAIYGSRSANGVILITTKSGKNNQKPQINLSSITGIQEPKILFSPVKGYQNATLKNLALTNVGSDNEFTPDEIQDLYHHRDEEEWNFKQILQPALQQNHNFSFTGGGENNSYFLSGGFMDQNSNFVGNKNYGIQRYNLRSNLKASYGIFTLNSILSYSRNNGLNTTATNAIINSSRLPPYYYYKMQSADGKYLVNNALTDQNPLGELNNGGYIKNGNDYFNANLALEVKLFEGLKIKGVFGADINANHRFIRRIEVPLYPHPDAEKPSVFMNSNRNTEDFNLKSSILNYQFLIDYVKKIHKHDFKAFVGLTNESSTSQINEIKLKFTDPILGTPTTGTEIDPASKVSPQGTRETSISSIIGRLNYEWNNRYYLEGTFRYDGSSRFAKEHRWGFFPSISAGWRITEEAFLQNYKASIGDIKFRSSYGVLGNQDIDPYQFLTIYSSYNNVYGFDNQAVAGAGFTYGNNDLRWEKTKNFNLGLDLSFLNNQLTANIDYFIKNTSDILITPEIPSVFGTVLSKMNIGRMKNEGWEFNVTYRLKTGNFQHNISANLGDNHNVVTYFEDKIQISNADNVINLTREGLPIKTYFGYNKQGLFQNIQEIETAALPVGISPSDLSPGDVRYVDRNHDGIIDSRDRFVLGHGFPRFIYGLNYQVNFRNFDFSMLWQGVGKRDMMIRGELVEPFHSNYSYAIYQHQLDFWTPTNTDAKYPRLTAAGSASTKNNYQMESDLYKFSGQYARLKNIQIGYTIPNEISKKLQLEQVRFFVNAQNLLTLSLNSWIDPESSEFDGNMNGRANSARNYPTLKYYGFGLNVKF